jgi:hypothetical protein
MPQDTNLNVAPYFDDFDPQSNYYKVLFKPGYPVQARELNNVQSILQNQVEDVGNHLFKEGAQVIPGNVTYNSTFYAIQIQEEFLGVPVSLYLDQLVGQKISGRDSGVTAKVITYITNKESDRGNYTLYVTYFDSAATDAATETFFDNEVLVTEVNINYATTFISAGEGFANTISTNASAKGSAFTLSNGVYFLRGTFVDVEDQILILDQYSNKPNYRIGLQVTESIVSSDVDPTLTDNAQGFNNFSAPGADRFKISAILAKRPLDDFDDNNFVQLSEVIDGVLRSDVNKTEYNLLADELARRTYDESGNYYIKEFTTSLRDSLNNNEGNRGIYEEGQTTQQGSTPNESLAIYRISPGKAYVKGFETETRSTTLLDCPKPRTTRLLENQAVNFGFGPTFEVDTVFGSATIGFNTSNTLSLRDQRVSVNGSAAGKEIGVARIYDFALESGSYDTTNSNLNRWDLSLFDVQTNTDLTINENVDLTLPTYIQGESSGATAYLRTAVSAGTAVTAYNVKGNFFIGENLVFNGVKDNDRYVTDVRAFGNSDIQSVYGIVGAANTFTANVIPKVVTNIGNATLTPGDTATGVSTVTNPSTSFIGIATVGNLVQYTTTSSTVPSIGRITENTGAALKIVGVATVTGVIEGSVPTTLANVNDLSIVGTKIQRNFGSGNESTNQSLYSIFPKKNLSSVDLSSSNLVIRRQFQTSISADGETPAIDAGTNETFLPFDEERYILIRSNGVTEVLTSDKVVLSNGSTTIQIIGLSGADTAGTILIATLRKSSVNAKIKRKSISNDLIVNKSKLSASGTNTGFAGTTLNDGLLYGNYPFGTRVQDSVISLNVPDVVEIHDIFESTNTSPAESPSTVLGSFDGPTATSNDLIVGEVMTGTVSGAKARYLVRKSDTTIGFVYLNDTSFEIGEVVQFDQSGVSAIVSVVNSGSLRVTDQYTFDNGQRETIYDYSRLVRKPGFDAPTRQLRVYYSKAFYDSADTGDITIVNSYNSFDYSTEINSIDGVRNTDMVDARPRVKDYSITANSRSPLEFYGRDFDGGVTGQHSSKDVIASDESMTVDFNYYLGRADRVYLSPDGGLSIKFGTPSEDPKLPDEVSGALNIANIFLPAYLYTTEEARVSVVQHKRYQMRDISKLEQRIKNLEYYSSLSLIETNTLNLFVPDSNGLNRFKSGIFIDNFSTLNPQDTTIGVRNSVDLKNRILRPSHYTTAINLQVSSTAVAGIGTTTQANQDSRFAKISAEGVRRTNQTLTLDYSDTSWLQQPFATRTESVTPFLVQFWNGSVSLEPDVDVWIDVNRLETRTVENEGAFEAIASALQAEVTTAEDGTRLGVTPVQWDSWETVGVNVELESDSTGRVRALTRDEINQAGLRAPWGASGVATNIRNTTALDQQRTGSQSTVTEVINNETLGDRVVSRELVHFIRSRNIEFTGKKLKPFTQVYSFFDGVDVNTFSFSKLVEIEMIDGTFVVGETVSGDMPSTNNTENVTELTIPSISFRVANSNHKYGPYNDPTDFFDSNPYDRTNSIPSTYSETSSILNIDTFSLQNEEQPEFEGRVRPGMILTGGTSGASARVSNVRLITDRLGTLIGSFRVPDISDLKNPVFETGRSTFKLTNDPTNSPVEGFATTAGEEIFYSEGSIDNTQEVTLSLRNARVEVNSDFQETRQLSDTGEVLILNDVNINPPPPPPSPPAPPAPPAGGGRDPLAQTFFVDDETGVFITKVDVFFSQKDDNLPVIAQLRETTIGTPNLTILPYSEVELDPKDVNLSTDGTVPTTITFESPVYLSGQKEYALVLLSDSLEYRVFISRLGEADVTTLETEAGQRLVSKQPILGSLFKSQNASVWTPSQYEDLKFTLYRANFTGQGFVGFFNPQLPTSLSRIPKDGLTINSRNLSVGIGTTVVEPDLEFGNTILQVGKNNSGTLVGYAGSATSTLTITNSGIGYTPSSGGYTFAGVALTSVTGNGLNATADIYVEGGVAVGATINEGGKGYSVGDVLRPLQVGNTQLGRNMKLSVGEISGNNELIIDNVQGEFDTSTQLSYINKAGITTTINSGIGGNAIPVSPIRVNTDGLHIEVFQRNHGMHTRINQVTLSDIGSDVSPTTLAVDYSKSSTGNISIGNSLAFGQFEGIGIGTTNPGYAKIGKEIISYTGVAANTLTGITRGIDNTLATNHSSSDLVYKYELDGVSLRRINRTHSLGDVTKSNPIGLDYYNVKVDFDDTDYGTDRGSGSVLGAKFFNTNTKAGGISARGTYNLPFNLMIPKINTIEPKGTDVVIQARTISETSISGAEASFVDKGYIEVTNFQKNYFEDPRMIASQINENTYLSTQPGNKSLTVGVNFFTSDNRLSPAIDLDNSSIVFVTNRVNAPVTDYASDPRVNTTVDDPNNFTYVSKNVLLENPATGLKVYLDAYISRYNDVRVFYALDQEDSLADETVFVPFPGYGNFDIDGNLISQTDSDGSSDINIPKYDSLITVPSIDQFREYTFTNDNLPAFKSFRIKIIGTSTNQSIVPQIRNLRTIALA